MTNEQYGSLIQRLATIEEKVTSSSRRLFGDDDGHGGELAGIKARLQILETERWRLMVAGAGVMIIVNFFTGSGQLSLTKLITVLPK